MRYQRLGCFSGIGIVATIITVLAITGLAFAGGGGMFSPGALNADPGDMLGGVSSHAEIAGECGSCHVAPWQPGTMDDRCIACHQNIASELNDTNSIHGKLKEIDSEAQCRDCHPEHNGAHAALTVLEEWNFPHQVTGFSLNGHQFRAGNEPFLCSDCHGNDVTTFDLSACSDCHRQSNETFLLDHGIAFGVACLNCHDGLDTYGNDFDHGAFGFPLTGGHAISLCSQCHLGSSKIADLKLVPQACFACHATDDPHGGKLGTDCASCHTPAGWKPANFNHDNTNFKLVGAHLTVTCSQCHTDTSFAETPTECFACHQQDDPHQGRFGTNCASCHNPNSWKEWTFDHSLAAFQLTGKHTTVACENCHTNGYRGTPKDCFSCHKQDEPHRGQFGIACEGCHVTSGWKDVTFDHSRTGFPLTGLHTTVACQSCHANGVYHGTPKNCYACHAAKDAHNGKFGTDCASCHITSGWQIVNFDHGTTGFPLTGQHNNAACTACHTSGQFTNLPTNCYACHASDDHHNGQFGQDCSACHTTTSWSGATFNHNNTNFPLTGRHNSLACTSCHTNGVYKGTPSNCYACHASDDHHNGQFGQDCKACHTTNSWSGASFNHNNTSFSLTGQHNSLACTSCHTNGVYKGTPTNCYACHASKDAHKGQFGTNCGSCHTTNSWSGATFNHNNTAFPLTGSHTSVVCTSCHTNGVYKGTPTNCFACHASKDAHNGQFGTNCGSCHNTNSWSGATFNHNNTSFPLTGRHTSITCSSCHANGIYKGTPSNCYACHASDDNHGGRFGTNCGSCHSTSSWGGATFDHNLTSFPLVGKHRNLSCESCHRNGVYQGLSTSCVSCHQDPHNGRNGTDCAACHTPSGWGD